MPDEPLGTAALHRTVAAARAAAGAGIQQPAPPPDAVSAPWAQPPMPVPAMPPRSKEPRPPRSAQRPAPLPRSAVIEVEATDKNAAAWTVAHKLLQRYGKEMGQSLGKADLHLAQGLMENGVLLLQNGVPMDALGALVRLGRDLARNPETEGLEDPGIDELRKVMERSEASLPSQEQVELSYREDEDGETA